MTFDAAEQAARLELARPEHTLRGQFFQALVASTQAAIGAEAAQRQLAPRRWTFFLNYPLADFLRLLARATDALEGPAGSRQAALRRLGEGCTDNFFASPVVKTALLLVEKDPSKFLATVPRAYRTAMSHGTRTFEKLSPARARLTFREELLPMNLIHGSIAGGFKYLGTPAVQVESQPSGLTEFVIECEW